MSPPLDEQFLIYRLKKIIGDSLAEGDADSGGQEFISYLSYENHFKKFKKTMEKCAHQHYEFWNLLIDDSPDLGRVSSIGDKITDHID